MLALQAVTPEALARAVHIPIADARKIVSAVHRERWGRAPMPWNTTPWTRCPGASSRRTSRTCSTISHASRLRTRPSRPVAQNAQPSAQPTCELTHTEKRPARSSGMRTASKRSAPDPRSSLRNGSSALF